MTFRIRAKQIDFSGSGPKYIWPFAGGLTGDVGAVTRYWSNEGSVTDSSQDPVAYPSVISQVAVTLMVQIDSNDLASSCVFALAKNGVATGLSLSVNAVTTGQFSVTGTVSYVDTDTLGLIVTNTGGGAGNVMRGTAVVGFAVPS